ncbi:MAG: hypothetical protein CVT89_05555 [Candidatus Altiarchaeales archaeon HGW-Altiarchaeales-2]|nr:MAG: hypothetical protein CVT89_05555 [Candidatus Altiarchaeales archaeon HGW-Altiarchaeales-2]
MPTSKNITEVIGDSARYLLILFIGFLFIKIYFPQVERYIDINLFFIITIVILIAAILLEKKFIPERYRAYAEDEIEDNDEGTGTKEDEKISLTKKEILYVAAMSILGMALVYYALFLNYKLLPVYLLLLLSVTAGLLIAFLSYETMKEDKKKTNNLVNGNLNREI